MTKKKISFYESLEKESLLRGIINERQHHRREPNSHKGLKLHSTRLRGWVYSYSLFILQNITGMNNIRISFSK